MSEGAYTSPEMAAERAHARRVKKRMDVKRGRHGNCCICKHRDVTFGVFHCRGNEGRFHGACEDDVKQPRFEFDDTTLGEFQDAA